jgi:hypothetical protein
MRRTLALILSAVLVLAFAAPALAAKGGEPGSPISPEAIWADGTLFATIGQGSLHYNGHDDTYDRLYQVPDQAPISEAGPTNPDYNGGRWLPTPVTWNVASYEITSAHALHMAAMAGDVTIHYDETGDPFLCPLLPNQS